MTTWQEVARSSFFGTYQEWREVFERCEAADQLDLWEYVVTEVRPTLGLGPREVLRWVDLVAMARTPNPKLTEQDFRMLAENARAKRRAIGRRSGTVLPVTVGLVVILALLMTVLAQCGLLPTGPGQ